ncbi:MAG: hypothetical protein GX270_01340 [Clostridiaceae bacterium]|jgi:ABC-type microcin C transport system permease subunit YejE|nr:hypothetical protein [Clostridiaceae bacterium]
MNRVQKFREIRRFKIKLILVFSVFFLILFTGIAAADYSMSSLLSDEQRIHIFSIHPYGEEYYRISLFDKKMYINTKYISQDYKKMVDWIDTKRRLLIK